MMSCTLNRDYKKRVWRQRSKIKEITVPMAINRKLEIMNAYGSAKAKKKVEEKREFESINDCLVLEG